MTPVIVKEPTTTLNVLSGGGVPQSYVDAIRDQLIYESQRNQKHLQLDPTGAVSALGQVDQAVSEFDNDGGVLFLPSCNYGDPQGIKWDSWYEFPEAVSVRGAGMRNTKISLSGAGSGMKISDVDTGSRGGWSGGFNLLANGSVYGDNDKGVLQLGGVNTMLSDVRISSNPGVGYFFDGSQNMSCYNMDVANDGTKYPDSLGYLFDRGASGNNLHGIKSSYMQDAYLRSDCTALDGPVVTPSNNTIWGIMLERSTTDNPAIDIRAGAQWWFKGGNISHISFTPTDHYSIVRISNDAAQAFSQVGSGGATTRHIHFEDVTINGALGASWSPHGDATTRYATAFEIAANCASWRNVAFVGDGMTYVNVLNLWSILSSSIGVRMADTVDMGALTGGLGSSVNYINRADSPGRANRLSISSAATLSGVQSGIQKYAVSGSTGPIANIPVYYTGQRITCYFSGTPTINNSGNIKIKGASSISVAAGSAYEFECDGTNWHVMG